MNDDARPNHGRVTAAVCLRRAVCAAAALIGAGALLAGCRGASPGGGVASLGSPTATTATSSSSASGANGGGEASPGSQAIAYAACMRSHGMADFPDPQISRTGNEVRVRMVAPASIAKGNPKFNTAQQACRKLLPAGGPATQQPVSPQEQTQYLKAAACIRSHGEPSFPDPTFSGGGVHIDHQGLNLNSPTFQAAARACASVIPRSARGPGSAHEGSSHEAAP
jgi:hypothetical protein